ncbi:hypothetical protein DER46DRAFT_630993 [Fusarium sp. MPI-SDFR-AT-0072]|nr:hypothetical protein DER46DRAFT_630993 [Fusarium sp. MPI-SDFR-AT-0072]
MNQNAWRLWDFRSRSYFSTVTILTGIASAQIGSCSLCVWTSAVVLLLFIMGMLENNDDAVISFEDLARDYESAEIVEILNGKVWKLQYKSRK